MERRGMVESGGAALACAVAAAATFHVAGGINWPLVLGIGMCAGIAGAANYQARTKHSERVADEAPVETGEAARADGQD